MADDAFNQSLVLHVDDDGEREVIGFAPGPAGVAEIELAPGTHLSVDYAEPTTLCSIRTTRAADPRVIASVIGDDATEIVMSTPPTDRPVRIDAGASANRFRTPIEPDRQSRDAYRFGQTCVLASLMEDARRHVSMAKLMSSLVAIGCPRWWPTKVLASRAPCGWCGG
jgi:hypothetical protein